MLIPKNSNLKKPSKTPKNIQLFQNCKEVKQKITEKNSVNFFKQFLREVQQFRIKRGLTLILKYWIGL